MSLVRVGLAETKNFADGYDAIFGKKEAKKDEPKKDEAKKVEAKKNAGDQK
jgi:hypothetical protein